MSILVPLIGANEVSQPVEATAYASGQLGLEREAYATSAARIESAEAEYAGLESASVGFALDASALYSAAAGLPQDAPALYGARVEGAAPIVAALGSAELRDAIAGAVEAVAPSSGQIGQTVEAARLGSAEIEAGEGITIVVDAVDGTIAGGRGDVC
jgi:hypothetical protein